MNDLNITQICRGSRYNQTQSGITLWNALQGKRLAGFKFRRRHPIPFLNRWGERKFFIPDFYCPKRKLIIELEGKIHGFQKDYDENRDEVLSRLGLTAIRILNEEVLNNFDGVVDKIFAALITWDFQRICHAIFPPHRILSATSQQ